MEIFNPDSPALTNSYVHCESTTISSFPQVASIEATTAVSAPVAAPALSEEAPSKRLSRNHSDNSEFSAAEEISALLSKEDTLDRIACLAIGRMKYGSRAEGEIFEEAIFHTDDPLTPVERFRLAVSKVKKIAGERCCLADRKVHSDDTQVLVMMVRHWLEATDRDHRNGSNLLHYYNVWVESNTTEGFFHWLDEGEGKLMDLPHCNRYTLETQHVKYLTIIEREQYEVVPRTEDGKLCFVHSRELVDGEKMIFVMGVNGALYIGHKERGRFHHSSFFGGAAVMVAGSASVSQGLFTKLTPHSGHYRPVREDFLALTQRLEAQQFDSENLHWLKNCINDDEFGDKSKGK